MRYLLETTVISDLLRHEPNTAARLRTLSPAFDVVATSVVTYGEIWFGLTSMTPGRRHQERDHRARRLFTSLPLEDVTRSVADSYALIKVVLQRHRLMIPEADLWIAATALAGGYILVSRDAHFSRIPGLAVESWSQPSV